MLFFCLHYSIWIFYAVHDCQLVDDIPVEKLLIHDVPVDIICTPTQVIFTNTSIPKPQGSFEVLKFNFFILLQFSTFKRKIHVSSAFEYRNLLGQVVSWKAGTNPNTERAQEQNWKRDRAETSIWSVWETSSHSSTKTLNCYNNKIIHKLCLGSNWSY